MDLYNTYFILRHGETVYQKDKINLTYPSLDSSEVSLIKIAKEKIKKVAKKLSKSKEKIDLIYSSDFFRTTQTAEIIAKELGLEIAFDKRLRDINLGIYHGKTKNEFYSAFPNQKERFSKKPKNGESWNDVRKRVREFLKDVEKRHKDKKILIVSHGDPLWLLQGLVREKSNQELLDDINANRYIKPGELRKLN